MRYAPLFILGSLLSLFCFSTPAVQAATLTPGDLIKATSASVYYYGADLHRYVFPNEKTFRSWYSDFSSVKTITDTELASISIGGNVTYRPGTRLVKVTTDPKVYAVARGGMLRWVPDEATARSLYGADWAHMIDDLPDAFFTNYRVAADISATTPYSPSSEQAQSINISDDKHLMGEVVTTSTPPTIPSTSSTTPTTTTGSVPVTPTSSSTAQVNTPGYSGSIQILNNTGSLTSGVRLNVLASSNPSGGVDNIKLFSNGTLVQTCTDSPCHVDLNTNVASTPQTYQLRAEYSWLGGAKAYASSTVLLAANLTSRLVSLTVPAEVLPEQNYTASVATDNSIEAVQTTIYMDNASVFYCRLSQLCEYSYREGTVVSTTHQFYAIVEDGQGHQTQSEMKTVTVVRNAHPTAHVVANQVSVPRGGTINVEITSFDNEGVALTEILLDGTVLRSCNASSCQVTAGPWTQARTLEFTGHVRDLGGLDGYATSSVVTAL